MASPIDFKIVDERNAQGHSPVLLVCEHAANFIPAEYDNLGLSESDLKSHIAWDPGAMDLTMILSEMLDAPVIAQKISRLVYDCNRPPENPDAMRETSEIYRVPGNKNLTDAQKQHRVDTVYTPFRNGLRHTIDQRIDRDPIIVTMHSFTPTYNGIKRDVEIGFLHDSDSRVADIMLRNADHTRFNVQRNQPYGPADGVAHTLNDQAVSRGLRNVMIEVRNDLLTNANAQKDIADWLAPLLTSALAPQKATA